MGGRPGRAAVARRRTHTLTHLTHYSPPPAPRCSLLAAGVKGLHLYTLNMEEACFSILDSLDLKLPVPADE